MVRATQRGPVPTGRNEIRTADPILRKLFTIAHQRKISIQEIARRIDRTTPAVSNWKHGKHTPTMIDVVFLAQALGCEIAVVEKKEPAE
jgi:transcriptional regulator with XRE-family HTH domain